MGGIPALVLLIPLEHGEIEHICKGQYIWISQLERVAEPYPQCTKNLVNHFGVIGDKQEQVASLCTGQFAQFHDLGCADEFSCRTFWTFRGQRQRDEPPGAEFSDKHGQFIQLFTGVIGTARCEDALDHPAALQCGFENHKIALRKYATNIG